MNILVKDWEMPKDCFKCIFSIPNQYGNTKYCLITDRECNDIWERNDDCPLEEVAINGKQIKRE